jgi:hypothetical protein
LIGNDDSKLRELQDALVQEFKMTDLEEAKYYLETKFKHGPCGILVHQQGYISKVLEKFGIINYTPTNISMNPGCIF